VSFILDALRKSETERQREANPSLAHAPLATVRHATPAWTWIVIGALALALAALALAWWRSERPAPEPPPPALGGARPGAGTAAGPGPAPGQPAASDPGAAPAAAESPLAAAPRPAAELATLDPSLPTLQLQLLAFNPADPGRSSAWINGSSYGPGDRIVNGLELVEVRADGVILAYGGERFVLRAR